MRFGAPDIPDTSYWAHAWFELRRDRAAVPAVRGLNLKEPNSVRDRFLQHLFNPPQNESSTACCEYVLAGDNTCILHFSADDLKKLQHMLIASKYRVILARNCVCLSFFVNTCR